MTIPQDNYRLKAILERYLQGECTLEEKEAIEKWYETLNEKADLPLSHKQEEALKARMWNIIHSEKKDRRIIPGGNNMGKTWLIYLSGVAAVLVLCFWIFAPQRPQLGATKPKSQTATIFYQKNNTKNTICVVLPDESMVWLEPKSSITYNDFEKSNIREINLKGEAFFEVTHDPSQPFVVTAGDLLAKVVGTKFNVKTSENNQAVEIKVTEGKVAVSKKAPVKKMHKSDVAVNDSSDIFLTARQKVIYHQLSHSLKKDSVQAVLPSRQELVSDKLAFELLNVSMKKVAELIEMVYHKPVVFTNPDLSNCAITGSLSDETLDTKLELICTSVGAHYTIDEDEIIISGEGCSP